MPRKKTVQPAPIDIIVENGLVIEVMDDADHAIYRGSHKAHELELRRMRVIEAILDLYVQAKGVISSTDKGPLKSASALDIYIQLNGILPEIIDGGAIRKRIYPFVKAYIEMLIQLKNEPPHPKTS